MVKICNFARVKLRSCIYSSTSMSSVKRTIDESVDKNVSRERSNLIKKLKLELGDSKYYLENGLRKVYPYDFTYHSFCKGRWVGRKVKEMFEKEFRSISEDLLISRIKNGALKVNEKNVESDYVLKDNDFISSRVHRHEFPVLASPIPIIHLDDHLLVIDKPPSLPVHACGKYRLNTIMSILEKENNLKDLHNRLASGLMILARTRARAQRFHEDMRNRDMQKEYVCRVEGKFPDGVVECNEPIHTLAHRIGICIVSPKGKPSKTVFERLNYNGKSSTVLCKPFTGRMHQIRVHLQYLGHPIINDSFYNSLVFGPEKGKNCQYGKSIEQLITDIENEHQRERYIINADGSRASEPASDVEEKNQIALKALHHYTSNDSWNEIKARYLFKAEDLEFVENCEDCKIKTVDPTPHEQLIYLHALRYAGKDFSFESQIPVWAKETWTYD